MMKIGIFKIIYFSSKSNNTARFVAKLNCYNERIPLELSAAKNFCIGFDYILITPTYAGGVGQTKGAVPKQVIYFLNNPVNRKHCKAVIASGNTNFIDTYCLAGKIIAQKLNIPNLYQFELLGTATDVVNVVRICNAFWKKHQLS